MRGTIFILLFFYFPSCRTKTEQRVFEINLPTNHKTTESIFEVKKIASHIGLDSLEKPSDNIRLRISIGFGLVAGINVYEIKFKDSSWSGIHYFFQGKAFIRSYLKNRQHDGFNDEIDSTWIAKRFNPLCGWDKFMDTINSSGILNLPDQDDIPDCKISGVDGETYVFEWSNKTKYRYYTFWAFNDSLCAEHKVFQNFNSFFKSQLGFFETCWPRCWEEKK